MLLTPHTQTHARLKYSPPIHINCCLQSMIIVVALVQLYRWSTWFTTFDLTQREEQNYINHLFINHERGLQMFVSSGNIHHRYIRPGIQPGSPIQKTEDHWASADSATQPHRVLSFQDHPYCISRQFFYRIFIFQTNTHHFTSFFPITSPQKPIITTCRQLKTHHRNSEYMFLSPVDRDIDHYQLNLHNHSALAYHIWLASTPHQAFQYHYTKSQRGQGAQSGRGFTTRLFQPVCIMSQVTRL